MGQEGAGNQRKLKEKKTAPSWLKIKIMNNLTFGEDSNASLTVMFEITANDLEKEIIDFFIKKTGSFLVKLESDYSPQFVSRIEALEKLNVKTANILIN